MAAQRLLGFKQVFFLGGNASLLGHLVYFKYYWVLADICRAGQSSIASNLALVVVLNGSLGPIQLSCPPHV